MKIPGKLTISRIYGGLRDNTIEVRMQDPLSVTEFVTAELSLEDFAKAVTGQGFVDCTLELHGLDRVGKKRETKPLEFTFVSNRNYKGVREEAKELCQSFADDGWIADGYFGTRGAIEHSGNTVKARCQQSRYVEVPVIEEQEMKNESE